MGVYLVLVWSCGALGVELWVSCVVLCCVVVSCLVEGCVVVGCVVVSVYRWAVL
jgi:hypothetical protein